MVIQVLLTATLHCPLSLRVSEVVIQVLLTATLHCPLSLRVSEVVIQVLLTATLHCPLSKRNSGGHSGLTYCYSTLSLEPEGK